MKKGEIIEKISYLVSILAVIAMIVATIYHKLTISSMAAVIGCIAAAINESAKKKNQKDNQL